MKYLDFTRKALKISRSWPADLVYTRMLQVARAASLARVPVILELHDIPSGRFGPSRLRDFLRTPTHKRVVFITRALRKLVEERLEIEIPEEEVIIAPDGVDLERYANLPVPSDARRDLPISDRFTVLYSGSFYQGRGMQMLFDLAGALSEMQFIWVGGSPEEVAYWRQKVTSAGLENVILTGFVSNAELPRYQASADLLLMPYSRNVAASSGGNIAEVTSPMKLFEYMACGRTIVTSDLPVLHEVLSDQNAVFCPPDDLVHWIYELKALAEDASRRQRLGKQAWIDVQKYSWRYRMKRILDAWKTLGGKNTDE